MSDEERTTWTVSDWAEALGVSRRTVQRWRRRPGVREVLDRPPLTVAGLVELERLGVRPGWAGELEPCAFVIDAGRIVRELRRRGWTHVRIATAAGVDLRTAYRWASGEDSPRPTQARRLVVALGDDDETADMGTQGFVWFRRG